MPTPTQQHPDILSKITYPAIVYQKTAAPPGYVAIPVASEAEVLAIEGGPVFLTAQNAVRYIPAPEQPMPWIRRTDNSEQFVIGKSEFGREIPLPVEREATVQNTYIRTGPPDPPEAPPPEDPPAQQSAPAQQPAPAPTGGTLSDPPPPGEPGS